MLPVRAESEVSDSRWWPDIAVRAVAAVAAYAVLCFTVAEGVIPGATLPAQLLLFPLMAVLVVLGVVRGALRVRSGRPVAWWRPGAVTAALVVFFAFPWLVFLGYGQVPLRANFAASQGALQDVVDRIVDAGAVPSGLPTGNTGDPVWIGGFHVRDIDASCSGSAERLARHECLPDRVTVTFRITGLARNGGLTRAVYLAYCGDPACYVDTTDDSDELGPHWATGYNPVVGGSLFLVATWYLAAMWLLFLLVYVAVHLVRLGVRTRR
jgi:hypothetical protein